MRMGPESGPAASGGLSQGLSGAAWPLLGVTLRVAGAQASLGSGAGRRQVPWQPLRPILAGLCWAALTPLLSSWELLGKKSRSPGRRELDLDFLLFIS